MEPYESAFEETPSGHFAPTVVVGIADNKARECKEKINTKVAVVDNLVRGTLGIGLQKVENYDHNCRNTTQTVENFVAGF